MTNQRAKAFNLRLQGYTYTQIASETGWSELSLRKYFSPKGKWYEAYEVWAKREIQMIQREVRQRMAKRTLEAISVLEYSLTLIHTKPMIALRAASEILDRAGIIASRDQLDNNHDLSESIATWLEKYEYETDQNTRR